MRRIEARQDDLEDLEDTKCRRKSYALAQRESLPIPLPLPVYPPPKPIARPPPPKTIYRPIAGIGPRSNTRGYRPSASANQLPSTPEVPSTPPVRNQPFRGISALTPTPEEPSLRDTPQLQLKKAPPTFPDGHLRPETPSTPETSPNLSALRGRPKDPPPPPPPRTTTLPPAPAPVVETNNAVVLPQQQQQQQQPSTPSSLPPTPPTHHLPPTPTSLSRSNTPTSITCPRTPTSIRAAPWQPSTPPPPPPTTTATSFNTQKPLQHPHHYHHHHHSSPPPTVAVTRSSEENYPPTPPSSPSYPGLLDVTPSSSLSSSLDQGLGHSQLSLGSISQNLPEHLGQREAGSEFSTSSTPSCLDPAGDRSYPAILNVAHLNVDMRKDVPALESNGSPKDIELASKNLNSDLTSDPVTDLAKNAAGAADGLALNNLDHNEVTKDSAQEQTYQTYRSRFWILALFSATAFLQSTVWGTFGSIAESAKVAFPNWTDATIAAFPNWGPITVVISTIPMMWVTQKLGLRLGMIACVVLITLGTLLRCVTSQERAFTVLCHVGSVLNAFAACLTLSLPAMVAATWFPPDERTTATAVGALWCQLGGAAIYMGPLIVRAPTPETTPEEIRSDIMTLMYIHFGAAFVLLIAVLAYFPATPPSPPSASSAQERIDFMPGIKAILKNRQLLLVLLIYSFSFGVPVVWIGVLTFSLLAINIHQDAAMGVAVTAVLCSGIAAFITARITDKVYGHLKITIIGLLFASSLFFFWFLLLSTGVITPSLAQAYVSVAGGVSFEYATVPLLVEFAVELGYPIPEGVVGAVLTLLFNVVALVFLGIFQIPDIGYTWVSYVLLACVSLTTIPLLFVKETHKRSDKDLKEKMDAP